MVVPMKKQLIIRILLSCLLGLGIGLATVPTHAADGNQGREKSFFEQIPFFLKQHQPALLGIACLGILGYLFYFHPKLFTKKNATAHEQHACTICLEDKDILQFTTLSCTHSCCTECLTQMTNLAMQERTTAQLRCPECQAPITEQDIRAITNNDQNIIDRYGDITTQEWIRTQPNAKHCQTPDCTFAFVDEQPDQRRVMQCPQCTHNYCSQCMIDHSLRVTCAEAAEHQALAQDRNRVDQATEEWKRQNTKACPQCRMAIERTEGCDYMQCTACRHQFCWNCLKPHDHNVAAHRCH